MGFLFLSRLCHRAGIPLDLRIMPQGVFATEPRVRSQLTAGFEKDVVGVSELVSVHLRACHPIVPWYDFSVPSVFTALCLSC